MNLEFSQRIVAQGGSTVSGCVQIQNNFFGTDRVADQRRNFQPLIEEHTHQFQGREEIFDAIGAFAAANPGGYFAIVADSGLGKTALAAEIARRHKAIAFFASASENRASTAQCLNHLCAETIARFQLDYEFLPARSGTDAGFLMELLDRAVAASATPVWLVIDALDETDWQPGSNPLALPQHLPAGVFLVVTHRPGTVTLATAPGLRKVEYRLARDSRLQICDLERFLHARLAALATRVPSLHSGIAAKLAESAAGNFLYLTFLLADIEEGLRTPAMLDSQALPTGLEAYYEQLWSAAGDRDTSVIELICAAFAPVNSEWLGALSGGDQHAAERLLKPWRRVVTQDSRKRWHVVHQSFADFAAGKLDLASAHKRIAAWFTPERRADPYASRYLTAHLEYDAPALFTLVRDTGWSELQDREDPTGAAYLTDLKRAWQTAERRNALAVERGIGMPYLPEELWCASRFTALAGILPNYICSNMHYFLPSDLLPISAAIGLLEYAPNNPQALAAVWDIFAQDAAPSTFERVFEYARKLSDEKMRQNVIGHLARPVPADRMAEVFDSSASFTVHRAELLAELIRNLPPNWPAAAQTAALRNIAALECAHCRGWLGALAASRLAPELRREALGESLAAVRLLPSAVYRAWTLAQIAAAGNPPDRELIREAFEAAGATENPDYELRARLAILEGGGREGAIDAAGVDFFRELAGELACRHCRAVFLAALSAFAAPQECPRVAREAELAIREVADPGERKRTASAAAHYLQRQALAQRRHPPAPPAVVRLDESEIQAYTQQAEREPEPEKRADSFLTLAGFTQDPVKSNLLRKSLAAVLEAARRERSVAKAPKVPRGRRPARSAVANPVFRPIQDYEEIPAKGLTAKLTEVQQMMDTPYPLPQGFTEADLLGHRVLPWDFGTFGGSDLKMHVGNINFLRLSWVKDLCGFYSSATPEQRNTIVDKVRRVISQISFANEASLARAIVTATLHNSSAAAAALAEAAKIEWPPYRAEALLMLYPLAPPASRTTVLKTVYRAAFQSHKSWRKRYLEQIVPALSALPRPELYELWRDAMRRIGPFEMDSADPPEPFDGALPMLFPIMAALANEDAANRGIAAAYEGLRFS
ncbi:MAG TPA: hypothetical protein VME43_24955 [Bryobacteraceae bacterium]|nr:hypothetical protein [Bryobacteraceae bacterium]